MNRFKILILLLYILVGCGEQTDTKVCPECKMRLPSNSIDTAYVQKTYFDDMGCMVVWGKKHNLNLEKDAMVFAKDTQRYIKATDANYKIGERTPMGYGFTPYEQKIANGIGFEEMRLRILRGETMRNPKIRKQILGGE